MNPGRIAHAGAGKRCDWTVTPAGGRLSLWRGVAPRYRGGWAVGVGGGHHCCHHGQVRVWVVTTVKPLALAKRRLRAPGLPVRYDRLVLAMAQDTVRAALACPLVAVVLVVTDDPQVRRAAAALGAEVVADTPRAGLNEALRHGAALAGPERWRVGLAADLPALRPDELAAALRAASAHHGRRAFVPDTEGTGTTMLAAPPGVPLDPRFGPGSATAHAEQGAQSLPGAGDAEWPSLRRDVDTQTDLAEARRLGLGPHTTAVYGDSRGKRVETGG